MEEHREKPPRLVMVQFAAYISGSMVSGEILADGFRARGWDIDMVFAHDGPGIETFRKKGYGVSVIPHKNWLRSEKTASFLRIQVQEWQNAPAFEAYFRKTKPDVVYINSMASLAAAIGAHRAGCRVIWHIRELYESRKGELRGNALLLHGYIRPLLRRLCQTFVGNSNLAIKNLLGTGRARDARQEWNAVPDSFFNTTATRDEARELFGLPQDVPIIGVAGTMRKVKGQHFFLEAFQKVLETRPDALAVLIGSRIDVYVTYLEDLVEKLGISSSVRFLEPTENMPVFFRACDAACVPSMMETFGRVIAEAFAVGTPVVATRAGGVPEFVRHEENGLLVQYGDTDALSQSCLRLLSDTALTAALTGQAKKDAKRLFDIRGHQHRVSRLVEDVALRRPCPEVPRDAMAACCPVCGSSLQADQQEQLECTTCRRLFPVCGGVPDLRLNRDRYFCEFPKEVMAQLLEAPDDELEETLRKVLREEDAPPRLGEYIMGRGRAGWKFLAPLTSKHSALDLGCGWGALAYSLSETVKEVVACDSTLERLRFLSRRARADGIRNLTCVAAGDQDFLPFPSCRFDLVVLNGVLEWVPKGVDGDPHMVQLAFLREVRRVLKPGGTLFLGIENRYAWKTWFSNPDGHTGLRFVAWLPRWAAHLYSRFKGQGTYRNYLYGAEGYQELLREAGFGDTEIYVPLPGYHHPTALVPFTQPDVISKVSQRQDPRRGAQLKQQVKGFMNAHFPDAFNLFSFEQKPGVSLLCQLIAAARKDGFEGPAANRFPDMYRINGEMGMATAIFRDEGYVVKVPLHQSGQDQFSAEVRGLRAVQQDRHALSSLKELFPTVLYEGAMEKTWFSIIRFNQGAGAETLIQERWFDAVVKNIVEFLSAVCRESVSANLNQSVSLRQKLGYTGGMVKALAPRPEYQPLVEQLCAEILDVFGGPDAELVYGHGDMKLPNVLIDPETRNVSLVLDWGGGFAGEVPGYDLVFLAVDIWSRTNGVPLIDSLQELWTRGFEVPLARQLAQRYSVETGIQLDETRWKALMAYQWMKRLEPLAAGYEAMRFNHRYLDQMFDMLDNVNWSVR